MARGCAASRCTATCKRSDAATVSPAAREIAAKISRAFDQDQQLAIKLNDAQHRLQTANGQLWSALHPGALGFSRYTQNATNCARVVVINYPPQSSTGGTIITSYGAVVGEPGSDLPSQG